MFEPFFRPKIARHLCTPLLTAAALVLTAQGPARAQDSGEAEGGRPGTFVLQVENDLFGAGTDQYYTQGVQVTFVPKDKWEPEWFKDLMGMIPGVNLDGNSTYVVALGQQMFTPEDTTRPNPDPTDRPYAGWLFGSVGAIVEKPDSNLLQNVSLDLGIVGPASLGGYTQRRWHSLIGVGLPRGWGKQLHNEPGIMLSYQARLRQPILGPQHVLELDVTPTAGVALADPGIGGGVDPPGPEPGPDLRRAVHPPVPAGRRHRARQGAVRLEPFRRHRRPRRGAQHLPRRQHHRRQPQRR